nr:MAG TPA: hypothetical protein [Caudoviricetes sp.]DAQ99435.1 MAG TPA: hypothetical protein [Caudoviricetes sp.]
MLKEILKFYGLPNLAIYLMAISIRKDEGIAIILFI